MYTKKNVIQNIPSFNDTEGLIEKEICQLGKIVVELKEFGEVPFLRMATANVIWLSSPKSTLYIGKHTGILKYLDKQGIAMYDQEFDVEIIADRSSAPYFVGYKPELRIYNNKPTSLRNWIIKKTGSLELYDLPDVKDPDPNDKIKVSLQFRSRML